MEIGQNQKRRVGDKKMRGRRRYKVWGEFPARKTPQYFFAKNKADLLKSFSEQTKEKIRRGKIKIKYDGIVNW